MNMKNNVIGWLEFDTINEASVFISQINSHLGLPTMDGKTLTWAIPTCLQDGYSPTATTENWYVIIKEEIMDCLTQEQKDSIIPSLPVDWYACGTPIPSPSGSTENI